MTKTVSHISVSSAAASQACDAAVKHAESLGVNINVGIVDNGGNLLAFRRMDGAYLHSIDIAIDKAYTAVSFGFPTGKWTELYADDASLRDGLNQRPRLVALGGGLPIEIDDDLIGGIGVSGASAGEDIACAQAGLDNIMS